MDAIRNFWTMHFSWLQLPTLSIRWTDILEIFILYLSFSDLDPQDKNLGSSEGASGAGILYFAGIYL